MGKVEPVKQHLGEKPKRSCTWAWGIYITGNLLSEYPGGGDIRRRKEEYEHFAVYTDRA